MTAKEPEGSNYDIKKGDEITVHARVLDIRDGRLFLDIPTDGRIVPARPYVMIDAVRAPRVASRVKPSEPPEIGEDLERDLRMFYGLPPHNTWSNHCFGDGYFAVALKKKYGKEPEELARGIGLVTTGGGPGG